MQAIEFEAVANQHMVRLPDSVPEGARLRVLVLLDEPASQDAPASGTSVIRNKPSPRLSGSVTMADDLIAPAVPADEWDAAR